MSKIIYCIAQFTPRDGKNEELFNKLKSLEANSLREDGCIYYRVTKHLVNEFAEGETMPIVFHEAWKNLELFEQHCQRDEIVDFFETECLSDNGLVKSYNVTTYMDE